MGKGSFPGLPHGNKTTFSWESRQDLCPCLESPLSWGAHLNDPPTATHELRPCAKAKASLSREARFGDDLEPDWPAHRSLLPGTQSLHRTHKPGPIRHPLLSWAALCFFLAHATPWAHTVRMLSPRLYRLSRHSPASTNTPIRLVLSERTRAVPTIRTVPAQQTSRAVGGS